MGAEWLQSMLIWVQAHPLAAAFFVFAAAVAESLFLFGLLVPGALLMFIAGALIGAGAMPLAPTFTVAIAGAIFGDSLSFALGYAYRGNLHRIPLLARMPHLVTRGEDFLNRHGGKSIILGRFVGPLRPVMPTITGAAGMSPWKFLGIDIIAALGWAPCYILPGVLFGASLELAAEVASRLALLLLVVVASVWALVWASRWLIAGAAAWSRGYAEQLLTWSRRHRRLGLLGPALADPRQPETPVLALLAVPLLALTWLAYNFVWGFGPATYPRGIDALIYLLLQELRTPWSDFIALILAQLGTPEIYLPLATVIGVLLWVMTGKRATMHWLGGILFTAVFVLGLRALMVIPSPNAYFHDAETLSRFAGGHILISGVVYGFIATILASRYAERTRQHYYSGFAALIVLIALSRLYLGLDWFSDMVIGLSVALIWVALLTLGYRRERPKTVMPHIMLSVLIAAITVATAWQFLHRSKLKITPQASPQIRAVSDWPDHGYARLPLHINDITGRQQLPLNMQASGTLEALRNMLQQAGWQTPVDTSITTSLIWLAPAKPIADLPLLPRLHEGHNADLDMSLPIDGERQWLVRLWRSRFVNAENGDPLWVGQIMLQSIQRRLGLLRIPTDTGMFITASQALRESLPPGRVRFVALPARAGDDYWPPFLSLMNARDTTGDDRISAAIPSETN